MDFHLGMGVHCPELDIGGFVNHLNLYAPTRALVVPCKMIGRWNCFSVTNASQSEAKLTYI